MSLSKRTRRTTHSGVRHREDAELNLVPLIDILSVMVAFLLVYSVDVEVIQNAKGVEIPQSIAETQPKQSVVVMITKDQLFVQGELIASLDEIRSDESPMIESLRRVLERPMLAGRTRDDVRALYRSREPFYARAAFTVDTTSLGPDQVAARIAGVLRSRDRQAFEGAVQAPSE